MRSTSSPCPGCSVEIRGNKANCFVIRQKRKETILDITLCLLNARELREAFPVIYGAFGSHSAVTVIGRC